MRRRRRKKVNGRPLPPVRSKYRPPVAALTGNRPTAGGQRGSASAGDVTTRSAHIGHLETVNNTTTFDGEKTKIATKSNDSRVI